ncbi:MAG: SoxR reducing system RseC family protein [Bacteroidales bacterium]|nr:SoxR reducing system RseC family protein [Bacteroidales bacterium]
MQKDRTIEHTGTVKSVSKNKIIVNIAAQAACAGCMASGICDLADQANKEIRLKVTPGYKAGDQVLVVMQQSMGFRALFLAYLLPFIIVMMILIGMSSLSVSEPVSGLTAFLSLIPYYTIIYLRKEKIGKSFSFSIKRNNK